MIVALASMALQVASGIGMVDVASCARAAAALWRFSSGDYGEEETTFTYKVVPPPAGR